MLLEEFNYDLPEELIAQVPAQRREMSKMLVLDRNEKTFTHKHFCDITDFLGENDFLVLNNLWNYHLMMVNLVLFYTI